VLVQFSLICSRWVEWLVPDGSLSLTCPRKDVDMAPGRWRSLLDGGRNGKSNREGCRGVSEASGAGVIREDALPCETGRSVTNEPAPAIYGLVPVSLITSSPAEATDVRNRDPLQWR